MAWETGAKSSGKLLATVAVTNASTIAYTAPAYTANVTTPSATAIIKEITLTNSSNLEASPFYSKVSIGINTAGGSTIAYYITAGIEIPAGETKVIELNTMLPAGATLCVLRYTAATLHMIVSGVEVQ